ncbi:MAG: radical SAM protein, partial [Candidatus Eremiobacteraeota bacterium]|nr:radical SAM protein [Candidatus Eremiobacteraeota bacterium]
MIGFLKRVRRHLRIQRALYRRNTTPPFLILFINSICNMTCEHCFYWRNLNRKDDLSFEEIASLSRSLGEFENLNLSGGEPFIRKEFADICGEFIRNNKVKQIYVPTNGYFTTKMVEQIQKTLQHESLDLLVIELSLDGLPDYHDTFRGARRAFDKAMETYDALAELQREDPRLRIHSVSTATPENLEQLFALSTLLYERCPQMDHHSMAIIRGDRKNPSLQGPALARYAELHRYIRRLWQPRNLGRYGSIV